MEWIVEEQPHLRGLTIEWAENGAFILSKQNRLYTARDLNGPFEPIAKIAASSWKSAVSRIRLGQRFLRFMVTNVVKLSNGDLFVTFDRSVGLIRGGKYKPLAGLVRPCRVLRSACATDADGSIYFG